MDFAKWKFQFRNLIFGLKWKKSFKKYFSFFKFDNVLKNEKLKRILFLALFWLKTNFKTQKIKIFEFSLWFQIKKWIWKSYFTFPFWLWNWKMKNENFSKFVLLLNQKTNYTFSTRIVLCLNFNVETKIRTLFLISYFNLSKKRNGTLGTRINYEAQAKREKQNKNLKFLIRFSVYWHLFRSCFSTNKMPEKRC